MTITVELLSKTMVTTDGDMTLERLNVRLNRDAERGVEISTVIARRPDVAAVIAYDPTRAEVVLVEQFRGAPFLRTGVTSSVEIVAGYLDVGESFEVGARRELREETGLDAREMYRMGSFFPAPTLSSEIVDLWCAIVSTEQLRREWNEPGLGELIRSITIPVKTLPEKVAVGYFDNALSILAVQWFLLNLDQISMRLRSG